MKWRGKSEAHNLRVLAPRCHPMGVKYHETSPRHYHHHCFYCGLELCDPPKPNPYHRIRVRPKHRTLDHVDPKINGGKRFGNTVPACGTCNGRKSALPLEEWRIVFFGIHGGEFYGERINRLLSEGKRTDEIPELSLANNVVARTHPVV